RAGATYTAGVAGRALQCSSGAYATAGDEFDLGSGATTFIAWVRINLSTATPNTIFQKGSNWMDSGDTLPGFGMGYRRDSKEFQPMMSDGTTWRGVTATDIALDDGAFHMIALTIDRSSTISLYVEGTVVASAPALGGDIDTPDDFVLCSYGGYSIEGALD